ncbi:homeobox protein cut-like [Teleopsis dalmanni]|nr:homeobox protein cut-like [Teleopsis dalmanni]
MTSDSDRSANAQVSGSVEGAMSQSQGQGGAAQSQAQVQVNSKNGGTKASSQSGGIIHQSQSEVQANDKGGLADAQSSGPGQTSSQAQIGFRPRQDGTELISSNGGGQASAQSGSHSGQSQSQIHGTSKYGVSYHGAAQSASGTKEQVATYREQNRELFHSISQFGNGDAVTDRVDTLYSGPALTAEPGLLPDLQLKASKTSKETAINKVNNESGTLAEDEDDEEPYEDYDDEDDYYENPIKMDSNSNTPKSDGKDNKNETPTLPSTFTQQSPTQVQKVAIANANDKYTVVQNQNGREQRYPIRTTTPNVPSGFRGTVNVEKKFHTKALESHTTENNVDGNSKDHEHSKIPTPDSYVTVTKSVTGSMDNTKNPPQENKNFQSTYYTKSSTCGYFTFSCNIVYGANGRSKICRPKAPTNGKC